MNELEKVAKFAKIKKVLKKYGYFALLGVAVITLVLTIVFVNVKNNKNVSVNEEEPVSTDVISFSMPVASTVVSMGYSNTELQYNSTLNTWRAHYGVDLLTDIGSEVFAVLDGTVKSVTTDQLNGTVITLKHANGLETVYGSLNKNVLVKVGDSVYRGQQIGVIALSATNEANQGAHLHFEVLENGNNIDPSIYLAIK